MKSLGVPFKKRGISEECTLVFVSAAQFVFVTTVTFIPHLLSRFTVFSPAVALRVVFSANICSVISRHFFTIVQSKELGTTKYPTEPNIHMNNMFIFEPLSTSLNFICFVTLTLLIYVWCFSPHGCNALASKMNGVVGHMAWLLKARSQEALRAPNVHIYSIVSYRLL